MNLILDLFFPKKCAGCKKLDTYFCQDCIANILQKDLICPVCGEASMGGERHPLCGNVYSLDGLWSLGWHQGALREAIKQFKYQQAKQIAWALTDLLVDYWLKFKPLIFQQIKGQKAKWVIMPVPLHWWRRNERGFNQSAEIAQILSKRLDLAYCEALKRTRYTRPQVKLKGYDRRQNIKNAFAVASSEQPIAKSVLLIDDVWTTGSTLKECCYVLKKAGSKSVWALTLAR